MILDLRAEGRRSKDDLDLARPASMAGAAFRQRIRVISHASVLRHPQARLATQPPPSQPRVASAVGICSSAGGPPVLAQVLGGLPADYQVPILVVQHISAGFTESLAHWLDQKSPLSVRVAEDGQIAGPGVWIAPEGAHLVLTASGRMSLDRTTIVGHHRPSGDVLLTSIATAASRRGVALVLTGMGNDGAAGAAAVHAAGGFAISQDEAGRQARAYLQALRTLDPSDRRHESLLQQVDLADIAAACRARLG